MGSKFGIVFAFLLSAAAAGGSYYLYQGVVEERGRREKVEAKYDQVKEKMLAVQAEKEQTVTEKDKYKAESEEYRNQAQAMQGQIEKLQGEQSKSKDAQEVLERQVSGYQSGMTALKKKVEELDRKAKEAQQACLAKPEDLVPAAQPFGTAAAVPVTAAVSASAPASDLAFSSSISNPPPVVKGTASVSPAAAVPAKGGSSALETPLSPKVLTVNRKFNFVVVNLGIEDGLKMGDILTVVKQEKNAAKLQVEKLYDKFCAATILEEKTANSIAEGDEVRRA